ncbi:hypothetical protein SDC9_149296 [bioreactor metagenome]|uniref:NAD-specific glutamate dehydrogenase n=1 Tax=bioreactor metagenome TaxID=1076179 RepID=A0A645ENG1_9ZZZZ
MCAALRELLFPLQFSDQLRQLAIFQLGGFVEIVCALRFGNLRIGVFQLLTQLLHFSDGGFFVFPLRLHLVEVCAQFCNLPLNLLQMLTAELICLFLESGFLDLQLHDLPAGGIQFHRHAVELGLDERAGFIHEVDCLVRQKAVGDVAMRQRCRGNQRRVLNLHAVEHLIALLESAQDRNRVLHGRFFDQHRLEPALQGRVFFDILTVLVDRGCTDAVQFAARQHGF